MQIKEIKKWEIDHDVTHTMIANDANVSQPMVTLVLKGERRSKAVIDAFLKRGCPKKFFNMEGKKDEKKSKVKKTK